MSELPGLYFTEKWLLVYHLHNVLNRMGYRQWQVIPLVSEPQTIKICKLFEELGTVFTHSFMLSFSNTAPFIDIYLVMNAFLIHVQLSNSMDINVTVGKAQCSKLYLGNIYKMQVLSYRCLLSKTVLSSNRYFFLKFCPILNWCHRLRVE